MSPEMFYKFYLLILLLPELHMSITAAGDDEIGATRRNI